MYELLLEQIEEEAISGEVKNGKYQSHHEAYAVILEEVYEASVAGSSC